MTVVPFSPKDEPGEGLALSIAEARAALALAANAPGMAREPYRMVLVGLDASLNALDGFVDRLNRPMDAELRTGILAAVSAIYERQARLERQERVALARSGAWKGRRKPALIWAGAVLVLLGGGAGLFSVGWSRGAAARVAELCQGDAVREQGSGTVCAFWLVTPTRRGVAGR